MIFLYLQSICRAARTTARTRRFSKSLTGSDVAYRVSETERDRELKRLLGGSELFSGLLDDDLLYLVSRLSVVHLSAGQALFRCGDPSDNLWIVKSGKVTLTRENEGGERIELAQYGPGESIGDFDMVSGSARSASAVATLATELVVFPAPPASLDSLEADRPDVASRIYLRCYAMLSARLATVRALIAENAPWVRRFRRISHIDPSTGLDNADSFLETASAVPGRRAALLMLKPLRLKELNDRYGHDAGDAAMSAMAGALRVYVRDIRRGTAYRFRSNETALLLPDIDRAQAEACLHLVLQRLENLDLYQSPPDPPFRSPFIGVLALYPEDGNDLAALKETLGDAIARFYRERRDQLGR
jgi:diguanylate cyclase (GGDEF)-like protein